MAGSMAILPGWIGGISGWSNVGSFAFVALKLTQQQSEM
jgi:hypothetical protein